MSMIRAAISPTILSKADRLFRNDDTGIFIELLQNARRAGAKVVDVQIVPLEDSSSVSKVIFHDYGSGIDDFQKLLTLGDSDWDADVSRSEDPAGMGFFSLCHSEVEVWSGHQRVVLSKEVFLGSAEAEVERTENLVPGTRIVFTRSSPAAPLLNTIKSVSKFGPLEVIVNGEPAEREDFLEGALHREIIDGIEVGFGTSFRWEYGWKANNWNFHGALIHHSTNPIPGLLTQDSSGRWEIQKLQARFNVLEVGRVKLQLPDRRAIVEDNQFKEFERKVRAAGFRFFVTQERHVLSFSLWEEARGFGITLPEASPLLRTWHAAPLDDGVRPFFGQIEEELLSSPEAGLLVDQNLPNQHTLEAALQNTRLFTKKPYIEEPKFAGYSWYDEMSFLTDTSVSIDGLSFEEWEKKEESRPQCITVTVSLKRKGCEGAEGEIPALIHVLDGDDYYSSDDPPVFVAVRNSPWDNTSLDGPFDVEDFLHTATFSSSDDTEADSWDTQSDYYRAQIRRKVDLYFRGERAALVGILEEALSWEARNYAERLRVKEIRFKRPTSTTSQWTVKLITEPEPATPTTTE